MKKLFAIILSLALLMFCTTAFCPSKVLTRSTTAEASTGEADVPVVAKAALDT